MSIRIIAYGTVSPFGCMNFDNNTDADAFIASLTTTEIVDDEEITTVIPHRELTVSEITAQFGDHPHYAGDEHTNQTGTTLATVVFSRTHPTTPVEELEASIRKERDYRLLSAFDAKEKYDREQAGLALSSPVTPTSPMTASEYREVHVYINELLDITGESGFPWNGALDPAVPWPTKPTVVKESPVIPV